jgi:hypothetical protein
MGNIQKHANFSFLLWAGLLNMLVASVAFAASQPWQKTEFITNSFYEIALGSEYGGSALKVRKWEKPVKIYVEHQVGDVALHNELLNSHIQDLRSITGLNIQRVKSKSRANIKYYFTSQKKLPALVRSVSGKGSVQYIKTAVCLATMRVNGDSSINSAAIFIPVNQARMHAKLLSCIVEELTQVLGLPRDSDAVFPSIFNDRSRDQMLTGLDVTLLKLLYHPKIKSGMGKKQLRPILRNVITRMRNKGQLAKFTKKSKTLVLCQYIDC